MMRRKLIDVILFILCKKSSFELKLLRYGIALIGCPSLLSIFKVELKDTIPVFNGIEIRYGEISSFSLYLGVILIIISLSIYSLKEIRLYKKKKFGLYQQYLMNDLEQNFSETVNKKAKSEVIITKTNISYLVSNNMLQSAKEALIRIDEDIKTLIKNASNYDNAILYYGGLMSVPFTFYTGMELDDRYPITVFDYDRRDGRWKEIKDIINSEFSPNISIENNGNNSGNSIISIGVSYPLNENEIRNNFPDYPISKISIDPININNHWNISFQKKLQEKFFKLAQELGASGTKTIHLILSAQNSVSFNLGRCYDNRNLPEIIVYQYEKGNKIKYPWGVKMKTSGIQKAEIITTVQKN